MKALAAQSARYSFGKLIDLACSEPVAVSRHGWAVLVVMSVEEYERWREIEVTSAQEKTLRKNRGKKLDLAHAYAHAWGQAVAGGLAA